jgi:hypothetical protein
LTYWWAYPNYRLLIEKRLGDEDVFVPSKLHLLKPKDGDKAVLAVPWLTKPFPVAMVFPQVEYVIVGRTARKKRLFRLGGRVEIGVAEFSRIRDILASDLEEAEKPMPHFIYRGRIPESEIQKAIADLELIPGEQFEEIGPEDVMDTEAIEAARELG